MTLIMVELFIAEIHGSSTGGLEVMFRHNNGFSTNATLLIQEQ